MKPWGTTTVEERFWAKVDKGDGTGCWLWAAATNRAGQSRYGKFWNGSKFGLAHRYAYELLVGPIPEGLEPDHLCRVSACVKAIADEHGPAHLEPVTHRENMLRGETIGAVNSRKTHCRRGHPFTPENTQRYGTDRACKTCRNAGKRARYMANPPSLRLACGNGHPWTEENTYRSPSGKRQCRTCRREAKARRRRA